MSTSVVDTPSIATTKPTILVVEDSQAQLDALLLQLKHLNYDTSTAGTCEEARELIRAGAFACALIDVGLPDGSGTQLLTEILESNPNIVPIMLTGNNDSNTVIDAMRGGAFDYLLKPADLMTLTTSLSRAVAHHELICERDSLIGLLREERDQLKVKIEAATEDIQNYAKSCETTNAYLHTLLHLTQLSAQFHSDDVLFRTVFSEMTKHVPLHCAAFCDLTSGEFWATLPGADGIDVIASNGDSTHAATDLDLGHDDPDLLTRYWVQRHAGIDTSKLQTILFPQTLSNLPSSVVGFYLPQGYVVEEPEREFLSMCAYFIAYEWQRSRLLLHAAHNASLGNIALEMVKGFLQSLTAIRTATDYIGETVASEDAREGLTIVADNVEYMTGQTQVFHDLSQVRADSIETVQIDEYLDQTLDLLSRTIKQRGLHVEKDYQTSGECVLLNGTALARTFLDLLSSAIRTVERDGKILLRIRTKDSDHLECEIIHQLSSEGFYGTPNSESNPMPTLIKAHPSFILAQRTVNSCGGTLVVECDDDTRNTFKIVLPRSALKSSTVQEPIR